LCRLTPEEFLWLGISEAGLQDPQTHESVNNAWFLPRADSHCWFLLSGRQTPHMFSRICGIDMRPERFENTQVALSSVARLNAIVIRADVGGQLRFHLLADSSSADYLWHCLLDTMSEFGGKPVGLSAYGMIR
jgi:sarcosine oxidase subunit gamma